MRVLSLFDGMSCGQIALDRLGIQVDKYFASEIDKWAIQITQKNYSNTVQLGSVTDWNTWDIDWSSIDLVTGGFPCQAWSMAGAMKGDRDERGALFWVMLDIMQNVLRHNPSAKFLIENVKMKSEFEQYITQHTESALGVVFKHMINSKLVSAQNRERYYWTNIPGIKQPEDKNIVLKHILENVEGDAVKDTARNRRHYKQPNDKSLCCTATMWKGAGNNGMTLVPQHENKYRKLTPTEVERLQTVPEGYTEGVSNTQRYKMLGNGWTVDVIAHILKGIDA